MKKTLLNLRLFFASLFRGMKSADEIISEGNKNSSSGNQVSEQKTESQSLYASLLRGEVTQEVKDLRYEMYESVRKSKEYDVLGFTGNAVKKSNMLDRTPKNIDTSDGLKVVLVQDNKIDFDGQNASVENIDVTSRTRVEADAKHRFKVTHEYPVRYKIEAFAKKVVVKSCDVVGDDGSVEKRYKLDIYVSQYPIENEPRAVYVTKELESLYESGSRTSDLTDIITLSFTTEHPYGDDDWKVYNFTVKQYIGIKKFDGRYILSLYASLPETGAVDVSEKYNDEVSVRKFKEKARREKKKPVSIGNAMEMVREKDEKVDIDELNKSLKRIKGGKKKK